MKKEALRHPKLYDLAARLGASLPLAAGYLTYFIDFVEDHAPQGNVGKWPNGAIARGSLWDGSADDFVNALVSAGFVDNDAVYRLVVHDWAAHCQNWVRAKLKSSGLTFVEPSYVATYEPPYAGTQVATYGPSSRAPVPNQTKPNQTEPIQTKAADAAGGSQVAAAECSSEEKPKPPATPAPRFRPEDIPLPPELSAPPFPAAWSEWLAYRRDTRQSLREATLRKQLEFLAPHGPTVAAEIVATSIRNSWKGLFEPHKERSHVNGKQRRSAAVFDGTPLGGF